MAIQSFGDKITEVFFVSALVKKGAPWATVKNVARRKLDMLNFATELSDLRVPPRNCLEALSGTLAGFHSIRVNDQWRIVFRWTSAGPEDVRIVDYH